MISHNSLEQDPDTLGTLNSVYKLLKKKGLLILTVPLSENFYRKYQVLLKNIDFIEIPIYPIYPLKGYIGYIGIMRCGVILPA